MCIFLSDIYTVLWGPYNKEHKVGRQHYLFTKGLLVHTNLVEFPDHDILLSVIS